MAKEKGRGKKPGPPKGTRSKITKWEELHMEDNLELVEAWARQGSTDEEIYRKIGAGKTTWYKWLREKPELRERLQHNKDIANVQVENAMFKSATGYEVEEQRVVIEEAGLNKAGQPITKKRIEKTKRHVPSNVTAGIFYLTNRAGDRWKHRQQIEAMVYGEVKVDHEYHVIQELITDRNVIAAVQEAYQRGLRKGGNGGVTAEMGGSNDRRLLLGEAGRDCDGCSIKPAGSSGKLQQRGKKLLGRKDGDLVPDELQTEHSIDDGTDGPAG